MKDYKIEPTPKTSKAGLSFPRKWESSRNMRRIDSRSCLPVGKVHRNDTFRSGLKIKTINPPVYYVVMVTILFFSLVPITLNARGQNKSYIDSLYNLAVSIMPSQINSEAGRVSSLDNIIKCGLGIISDVQANMQYFTSEQQITLRRLLERPSLETSIVSPSGIFRIHFDATGENAPMYNADKTPFENALYAAIAFDSAYSYEVGFLGYPAPPKDNGNGGDDLYDIYIIPDNYYGTASPETEVSPGSGKYLSFIKIHNSFEGFFTKGIAALQVTAAHEFHHAIQMGDYIYRNEDRYFMELNSTSMEELVFNDVNDYYQYIPIYFANTSSPFSTGNSQAYALAIWNIFLADTFGVDIIKRQWELMPQMRALEAINKSINEMGSSFNDMFNEFGRWCYYTGYRSIPGKYFKEAMAYPLIHPLQTFDRVPSLVNGSFYPVSNSYIEVINPVDGFPDSLTIIITNADYISGVQNSGQTYPFQYTLYNYNKTGAAKLAGNYYFNFTAANPADWTISGVLNNESGMTETLVTVDSPYPSPFYKGRHKKITIPLTDADYYGGTQLNIYSTSMELVYSSDVELRRKPGRRVYIEWEVLNNDGNKLPCGVYIYAVRSGGNTSLGKIVIFN